MSLCCFLWIIVRFVFLAHLFPLCLFFLIFFYQLIENQSSTGPVQTKPKQLLEVPSGLEKGLCRALFGFCL